MDISLSASALKHLHGAMNRAEGHKSPRQARIATEKCPFTNQHFGGGAVLECFGMFAGLVLARGQTYCPVLAVHERGRTWTGGTVMMVPVVPGWPGADRPLTYRPWETG